MCEPNKSPVMYGMCPQARYHQDLLLSRRFYVDIIRNMLWQNGSMCVTRDHLMGQLLVSINIEAMYYYLTTKIINAYIMFRKNPVY